MRGVLSMIIIYKYPIALEFIFDLELPWGAVILDIQWQDNQPVLWAIVNPAHAKETRRIVSVWTGVEFNYKHGLLHIKTLTDNTGTVWHIFEESR